MKKIDLKLTGREINQLVESLELSYETARKSNNMKDIGRFGDLMDKIDSYRTWLG